MNMPHDELLVLDWILCGQGAHADLAMVENLMRWRDPQVNPQEQPWFSPEKICPQQSERF